MCGIAGVVGLPVAAAQLQAMADTLRHRGPDDAGFFLARDVGLAFRRLAVIDLAEGRQPMSNEDGRIQMVFNGEIYGHDCLRRQLEARGHRFITDHADTEVLVHGWEEWGYELFPRLNGMFALAVWDRLSHRLVLARDRYGIKPLYFARLPGGELVFASEIRAILASGLVSPTPCEESLFEYLSYQNLWSDRTLFRGVHQLEPATHLTWDANGLRKQSYWDITFPRSRRRPLPELAEEHRSLLTRAIRRQLAADVPIHSYLSGGIDSTALTLLAHRLNPDITAFSCVFDLEGVGDDRICDERDSSRLAARTGGIRRHECQLVPDDLPACLLDYVTHLEDLRMGMGYPVYFMAQRIAEHGKVVLSGTGGDEFHAGYVGRFQTIAHSLAVTRPMNWRQRLGRWLGGGRPTDPTLLAQADRAYGAMLNCLIRPEQWAGAFTPEFLHQAGSLDIGGQVQDFLRRCPSRDWRDRVLYVDAKTYLPGLLTFEDKVSMAHGLETRVPLLDNDLVDFLLDVPFEVLWQGPTGKVLFRESVRSLVPPEIYAKPKMGFGPPDASWYRGKLRPWITEWLRPWTDGQRGIFQSSFVRTVLDEHFQQGKNNVAMIWSLLNLEAWCQVYGFYGAVSVRPTVVSNTPVEARHVA